MNAIDHFTGNVTVLIRPEGIARFDLWLSDGKLVCVKPASLSPRVSPLGLPKAMQVSERCDGGYFHVIDLPLAALPLGSAAQVARQLANKILMATESSGLPCPDLISPLDLMGLRAVCLRVAHDLEAGKLGRFHLEWLEERVPVVVAACVAAARSQSAGALVDTQEAIDHICASLRLLVAVPTLTALTNRIAMEQVTTATLRGDSLGVVGSSRRITL